MTRRSTPTEFTEADLSAIESAAKIVASRYRGYVDFNDLTQEAYLWLIENYKKVTDWREEYSELHAERRVVKSMRNACERYARKEKAEVDGFDTEDEFFYSIPMVAILLQAYLDPERFSSEEAPPRSGGTTSNASHDVDGGSQSGYSGPGHMGAHKARGPEDYGNLMAMVADVGRVFEAMPAHDQDLLGFVYGDGEPSTNIADLASNWGIEPKPAADRVRRVVGRLRERLGGASPYSKDNA